MRVLGLVVLALAPSTAAAEAIGDGTPHIAVEPRRDLPHPPAGLGGSAAFGLATQDGRDGWLVRLEYEVFPVMAPDHRVGAVFGFMPGFEYWRDAHGGGVDQGFSLPLAIVGGIRTPVARLLIGGGIDGINIDSIATDAGFGMYAPLAMANLSVDIAGIRLGVDARVVRRWQIGADDFTQYQIAISAGYTVSTVRNQPVY